MTLVASSVDTLWDVGTNLRARVPTPELVSAAAGLFQRDRSQPVEKTVTGSRHGFREGPQWRVEVSAGVVAIRSTDYAKAERRANRDAERPLVGVERDSVVEGPTCLVGSCLHESCGEYRVARLDYSGAPERRSRVVSVWSRKSRARMVERISTLDLGPMLGDGSRSPVMVTLTYPGDWLTVAPSASACAKHFRSWQKRYARKWGVPVVGIWKREFQRRGAPHYHLLLVPPTDDVRAFRRWVAASWADVVAHPDPVERDKHLHAGTGVDLATGSRMMDPRRVAVYFSKHGMFSAKDYQNDAPEEWLATGESVGRFWGVLGLSPVVAAVELDPREALHAVRVLRRWSRANRNTRRMPGERFPRQSERPIGRSKHRLLRQSAGYLVVNDGPALASAVARQLDQWSGRSSSVICNGSGAGPVGFLP